MLAINLDTLNIFSAVTNGQPVTKIVRMRHDWPVIPVRFFRNGVQTELADGSWGVLGLKEKGAFSSSGFLASSLAWTKEGTGSGAVYLFYLNLNTAPVNAKFTDDSVAEITTALEVSWTEYGRPLTAIDHPDFIVQNDYIRGDEGQVENPDPAWELPQNYLTKAGNLGGLANTATARQNLGLANMHFRNRVSVQPAFSDPGSSGDYFFDATASRMWFYAEGQWRYFTAFSA